MKISTKGRYSLRFMIYLAKHQDEGNISLKDVSQKEEISIKYLEQIVSPLTKAGLIHSTRGSQGGYTLVYEPEKYTVKRIIEVVEGPIACVACLETEENTCHRYSICTTVHFYEELNELISDYMSKYTLADFIK